MNQYFSIKDSSPIGIHNPIMITGATYNQALNAGAKSTIIGSANRLDLMPYIPIKTHTVTSLSIDCSTLIALSLVRILVYSDLNGGPKNKLIESTDLDCSTIGIKTYSVSYTFLKGVTYWVGVHSSSTATLRGIALTSLLSLGTPLAAGTTMYSLMRSTVTYGSAPSVYTTGVLTSSIGPEIKFKL